jgi:hypothetical protein
VEAGATQDAAMDPLDLINILFNHFIAPGRERTPKAPLRRDGQD